MTIHKYPGADHAFARHGGKTYSKPEADRALGAELGFLQKISGLAACYGTQLFRFGRFPSARKTDDAVTSSHKRADREAGRLDLCSTISPSTAPPSLSTPIRSPCATWRRALPTRTFAPNAIAWDEARHFPVAEMRKAAALGMGGVFIAEEFGGSELVAPDRHLDLRGTGHRLPDGRRLYVDPQYDGVADRRFRQRRAAQAIPAAALHHGDAGELLPDRAGRRLRRGGADDARAARRRSLMFSTARSSSSPAPARAMSIW